MKHKMIFALILLLASWAIPAAYADEGDEDTIVVIEEDGTPEDVVNVISLPERASDMARQRAASGQETANAAKEFGRDFGQAKAEESRNTSIGEQMRELHVPDQANGAGPDIPEQPANLPELPTGADNRPSDLPQPRN